MASTSSTQREKCAVQRPSCSCSLPAVRSRLLRPSPPSVRSRSPPLTQRLVTHLCSCAWLPGNEAAKQLIRSWAPQTTAIATGVVLINNPENMRRFVRARILLEEPSTGCIASCDDSLAVVRRALHACRRCTPGPSSRAARASHASPAALTCGAHHCAGHHTLLGRRAPTATAAVAGRRRVGPEPDAGQPAKMAPRALRRRWRASLRQAPGVARGPNGLGRPEPLRGLPPCKCRHPATDSAQSSERVALRNEHGHSPVASWRVPHRARAPSDIALSSPVVCFTPSPGPYRASSSYVQ